MSRTVQRPENPYLSKRDLNDVRVVTAQPLTELWTVEDRLAIVEPLLEEKPLMNRTRADDYVAPDVDSTLRQHETG